MKGRKTVSISGKKVKLSFKYFVNLKDYLTSFISLVDSLDQQFEWAVRDRTAPFIYLLQLNYPADELFAIAVAIAAFTQSSFNLSTNKKLDLEDELSP